jgi:Tetratricopeptide repeat
LVQRLTFDIDSSRRVALVVALCAVLAGCATETQAPAPRPHPPSAPPVVNRPAIPPPTAPTQPYPSYPQPTPAPTPGPSQAQPAPKPQSSATLALQDEAQRAATAGDYTKATQILERAIRIEPDRAELWLELARVHLKEGDAAQAEQFARKALQFTANRYDLEQQAWVVIADAKAANH